MTKVIEACPPPAPGVERPSIEIPDVVTCCICDEQVQDVAFGFRCCDEHGSRFACPKCFDNVLNLSGKGN